MAPRQGKPIAYEAEGEATSLATDDCGTMKATMPLAQVAVLPSLKDNCAIATRNLEAGLCVDLGSAGVVTLDHTILEGHRFAVAPIAPGDRLTSWDLGFGVATRAISPGDYCCNDSIIEALRARNVDAVLPERGNFENHFDPLPDPSRPRDFTTGVLPVAADPDGRPFGFEGFERAGGRGVGTRNYLVLLGTSCHVAAFVRQVERAFRGRQGGGAGGAAFDGVVAVAHTEGEDLESAHNRALLVRTLAGFIVHPNVGACLAVDHTLSPMRELIESFMAEEHTRFRGLESLPLRWMQLGQDMSADLLAATRHVEELLVPARAAARSWQPARHLTLALQCGGSDAFSGVCGNPASGAAARHLIAAGGRALLAETDELIGAEAYILERTRDREVEDRFLAMVERYHSYARLHGHSAEGNPSGGNKFRGLYNIALKSLGAAMKKPRDVRLDGVLDYGQRFGGGEGEGGGYFFMDSPGNDPESIAGQVACGCNVIHFITGNGSITNFPFVPTIKIITTTARWQLLSEDMDFNAGRLQEGTSLEQLSLELFQMTLDVSGGLRAAGERAGHWQVCVWRDWFLQEDSPPEGARQEEPAINKAPLAVVGSAVPPTRSWLAASVEGPAASRSASAVKALILPTSLCSGQVALKIAEKLRPEAQGVGFEDVVALPHSEGCGTSSSEDQEAIFRSVTLGHLLHPSVHRAILLEHGCEKTHNDWFQAQLQKLGRNPADFSWASIQLDGGIEKVTAKIRSQLLANGALEPRRTEAPLGQLRLGLLADHKPCKLVGRAVSAVLAGLICAGGLAVVPRSSQLLTCAEFLDEVLEGGQEALHATAPFAASLANAGAQGLHVMQCPPKLSRAEEVTGLAATGVDVILALVKRPVVGSPLVPVVQVLCTDEAALLRKAPAGMAAGGFDAVIDAEAADATSAVEALWDVILDVASGSRKPALFGGLGEGSVDFVIPRGAMGISL